MKDGSRHREEHALEFGSTATDERMLVWIQIVGTCDIDPSDPSITAILVIQYQNNLHKPQSITGY